MARQAKGSRAAAARNAGPIAPSHPSSLVPHPAPHADLRVAALLGLTAAVFYLFFVRGYFHTSDEVGVFEQTRALIENGNLAVPRGMHVYPGRAGLFYNTFGIGQTILALPFYALGRIAEITLPDAWLRALAGPSIVQGPIVYGGTVGIFFMCLYAPLMSGVLVALFFLFERSLGASRRAALIASALLATSTYVATMSTYFLQHTTHAVLLLGALYAAHRWARGGPDRLLAAATFLGAATILVRPTAAVAGPALAGYVLWVAARREAEPGVVPRLRRIAPALLLPFAAVAALFLAVNQWKWGTWLWSPLTEHYRDFGQPLHIGLHGFLLTPGCSVFLYSPLLLVLPWTLADLWRRQRAECAAVCALSLSFLLFWSKCDRWTGLWAAPGPRYLFVAVPLLLLSLGPWLDGPAARKRSGVAALAVVSLLGAAVQFVLMGTWFAKVIPTLTDEYLRAEPQITFVYHLDKSPILGSARLLLEQRGLDTWLWGLGRGWSGREGTPLAAMTVFAALVACLSACLASLLRRGDARPIRTLRTAPLERDGELD
jgi:hypothetical protein